MKTFYPLIIIVFFLSFNAFSQKERLYKMKKEETASFFVDKRYTSDSYINISNQTALSSLSISGKVKLFDKKSLVRVILVTKMHEHLVYEAYPLIKDSLNFSINRVCEETSLLNNETPIELIFIVRNAELELKQIHVSNLALNENEKDNFLKLKGESKKQIEKYKASKINFNNEKGNKTWLADATELADLPFEEKKKYFGAGNDIITEGFEYYSDGVFSFESFQPENTNLATVTTGAYPSSFDWRKRHGQNWMPPIRLQGSCGACSAFANIAVLEIMTNLYFNTHLNLDLSEQELVSCAKIKCDTGANAYIVFNHLLINPVCTEACFPYSASNEPCASSNKCTSPIERIGFASRYSFPVGLSSIKNTLIFKGPIVASISVGNVHHSMALIGYNVVQQGDTIKRFVSGNLVDTIVQPNDPLIGSTYWIFKNSYLSGHAGYYYIYMNHMDIQCDGVMNTPITSYNYSESNRICVDNDGDGYYNWGIGSKPTTCPSCSTNQEDGDDSNPNLGPLDTYGNCMPISSPFSYSQHLITTIETWQNTYSECGDVIVKNGGNLTISGATINLEGNATFSAELGSTLTFNSGTIQ